MKKLFLAAVFAAAASSAQARPPTHHSSPRAIPLTVVSSTSIPSEMGGAFMSGSKCDPDGNLYIRKYATDRPLLGPVVKITPDGERVAVFDPGSFSQLALDRADSFTPSPDGGLFLISQHGILKPQTYALHFSSDGSALSPVRLEAGFEVHSFAAFLGGNFLLSGLQRDVTNAKDAGRKVTAVFSADGRILEPISFHPALAGDSGEQGTSAPGKARPAAAAVAGSQSPEKLLPVMDLSEAEAGADGNLYVLRPGSPAMVSVISPSGTILRTLKTPAPSSAVSPTAFHVSANRVAISFWNDELRNRDSREHFLVVVDAQTGQKIATYAAPREVGPTFACYSADDSVFTFLSLGEGNSLDVIRAGPE